MNTETQNNTAPDLSNTVLGEGLIFRYSALGQPFFLREEATDCGGGITPRDWTANELRIIADFMDNNPTCRLYRDGSGSGL